jgi:hypothetical protein
MIVVIKSDPFHRPLRRTTMRGVHEQANLKLIETFIRLLPEKGIHP